MSSKRLETEKTLHDAMLIGLSRFLAAAIDAQPFQCSRNAWRTLVEFPELFRVGGRLVEGWFVIEESERITINEHVWCELATGQIVDPSVLLLVPATTPVFYFPGVARDYAETEALEGELFPHVRFDGRHGEDGLGHPGYKAARQAALRKVYARAFTQQPPKAMQFLTAGDVEMSSPAFPGAATAPLIEGGSFDLPLSFAVSSELEAWPDHCWYTARAALVRLPSLFFSARYVEGWLVAQWADAIRMLEHGWIETPQSGIVDPTIVLEEEVPQRLIYMPAVRLSWSTLQQYLMVHLPLAREIGLHLLEYQHACHQALARAEALAWQTGLPLVIEPGGAFRIRKVGAVLQMAEVVWDFPPRLARPSQMRGEGFSFAGLLSEEPDRPHLAWEKEA